MKIGFYVSGQATRLRRSLPLLRTQIAQIAWVLSDAPENAALRVSCAEQGLRLIEVNVRAVPREHRGRHVSEVLLEAMERDQVNALIVFGQRILSGRLLSQYENRIFNFHPSLLPAFPGLNAIDQARAAGAYLLGHSVHVVDAGIDTGPVVMQATVHANDYPDNEALLDLQIPMLLQLMRWLEEGRVQVAGGKASIKDADYKPGPFVPALEL